MDEILLQSEEIDNIFKNHLKIESKVMSIESLFANKRLESKIIYDPYYQRNYVWDRSKATYFIESILLGTEIPPLVFFDNQEHIEIIDGRQRYETIKNFIDRELVLSKNGLNTLDYLKNKNFNELDSDIKDIFWDTKIRLLEFSIVNEPKLDEKKEDLIKKEIFRRYNSGITPLKNPEIEKAIYINDNFTKYLKKKFRNDTDEYKKVLELYFTERDLDKIGKTNTLDKVISKIRHLLVLHNIPIKRYSTLAGRADYVAKFYDMMSNSIDDVSKFYKDFENKINFNIALKQKLLEKNSDLSGNRLVYECTFWILTILDIELGKRNIFDDDDLVSSYAEYLIANHEKFSIENSHFYKKVNERYNATAKYFENCFGLKLSIYLDDYSVFKHKMTENEVENNSIDDFIKLEDLRLNKPEPSSLTIEDICRQMNRDKFLLRPPYQREEVINKIKSSALIESILLGIKLPPIFVYKRTDGVSEVVDGQQRILSILGFIGEDFLDENGERVKSEKNNFKLNKLNILSELNSKSYKDLDKKLQDKILDFNLSVVIIDAKINPNFDKIDLFIRLNNKPYPIRDNSFEMWNSYIDKDVISSIKQNATKHSLWFHRKTSEYNTRMDNEELYTTLAYLEYKKDIENVVDITDVKFLSLFQREHNINVRIKEKSDITKVLNLVTTNETSKNRFMKSIKNVDSFVNKVRLILIDKNSQNEENLDEFLRKELTKLFATKSLKRTTQSFYSLWIILNDLNLEMVKKYRSDMKVEIASIFENVRYIDEGEDGIKFYRELLCEFKEKYNVENRKIKLNEQEKTNLLSKQNNLCPICHNFLFVGDETEVDHSNPLALGGRDSFLNLQIVHRDCNRKKKAKLLSDELSF